MDKIEGEDFQQKLMTDVKKEEDQQPSQSLNKYKFMESLEELEVLF